MKTIILIITTLSLAFAVHAQSDHFTVRVDGLGCPFCAYGLEKKFKEVDKISDIKVELQKGVLTYKVPASMKMTFEQVEKLVDDAGYTTESIKVERADGRVEKSGKEGNSGSPTGALQSETKLAVSGNCGMCKDRIEKAALEVDGVVAANWDVADQSLQLTFQPDKTELEAVHRAIAKKGHDTEMVRASDKAYNGLHSCCKYERELQ